MLRIVLLQIQDLVGFHISRLPVGGGNIGVNVKQTQSCFHATSMCGYSVLVGWEFSILPQFSLQSFEVVGGCWVAGPVVSSSLLKMCLQREEVVGSVVACSDV